MDDLAGSIIDGRFKEQKVTEKDDYFSLYLKLVFFLNE